MTFVAFCPDPLDERDTWRRRGELNSRPLIENQPSWPLDDAGKIVALVELERIELSPSRLKVERLTIRPQFQKLVRPVGIEPTA